ncbi:MAG: precorrin-2 C(20)-methyltransferase [Lachnospiraceae bacterium]
MTGTLYGIGVGPGDPELLTLKAVRIIRSCDVILVPGEDYQKSVAYQIAVRAVPEIEQKICQGVWIPMTRDKRKLSDSHRQAAALVTGLLEQGKQVGFLNLGDVTLYASYLYIHKLVKTYGYPVELVNGVPSFCAAAARLGIGLAEGAQPLHILPHLDQVEDGLELPGTKVIMKMGKQLSETKRRIQEVGMEAMMVENCGMDQERVCRSVEEIREDAGYYSLIIVKEQKDE